MKHTNRFKVASGWKLLLSDMNIDVEAILAHAKLPADLFHQPNASLSIIEYFRFWQGLEAAAGDREVPLLLAEHLSVEAFDAPIFASICSPDLNTALLRIQQYKPLIGPMAMTVEIGDTATSLGLSCHGLNRDMPASLELSEMVFFTQLSRLATREHIRPRQIVLTSLPSNLELYRDYFGCKPIRGDSTEIQFSAHDAARPFLTANAAMWDYFEEGLSRTLASLNDSNSTVERVRAALVELLPVGNSSIEAVASKLAVSKRTLQRKLTDESENYHSVLQSVRIDLADHYLNRSQLSLGEISFLLGYRESTSFIRAFTAWKGVAPGSYRAVQH
jgi:AraC-like DNA-binding protein